MQKLTLPYFIFTLICCIKIVSLDTPQNQNFQPRHFSPAGTNRSMNVAPTRNRTKLKKSQPSLKSTAEFSVLKPMDCAEFLQFGYNKSGVYDIWLRNKIRFLDNKPLRVFCDMETDGGGWTVIQRRGNFLEPDDYFYKDWKSYKRGFGDIETEFWLGNDNIFVLTNQRPYSARFDLTDLMENYRYALYDTFFIENEENKYRLTIKGYSGTASDSMIEEHNGQKFSTKDQDNDIHDYINCASSYKGGWWYSLCHSANLNGLNLRGNHESHGDGIHWSKWKGLNKSLSRTEIKIRPKNI